MTTKEQERKALEQIRKIVDGLGEGSYLATAFDGCFKDAEENIENDFACSYKDRFEHAQKEIAKWEDKFHEAVGTLKEMKQAKDDAVRLLEQRTDLANAYLEKFQEAQKTIKEFNDLHTEQVQKNLEIAAELKDAKTEIITLKAKLYDLLVK